jgi:hypothetical protein
MLTQRESFKTLQIASVYDSIISIGRDLTTRDENIPEGLESFKVAGAVTWEFGADLIEIEKSVKEFIDGFREEVTKYRRKGQLVFLVEPLRVYGDPTLVKQKKLGFYGWIELAVEEK